MDFLDTLDLNVSKKRSRRVRSWYLYEQFKSLEQNQVEAAEKLKERSYQDKILRQELNERRARRKLYDQVSVTGSEISDQKGNTSDDKSLSTSSVNIFGTYNDFPENEYVIHETEVSSDPSRPDSLTDQYEDYKTVEDHITIATETINSITNIPSDETIVEEYRTTTNSKQIDITFDEVQEQLDNLEKLAEFGDDGDRMSVSTCSNDEIRHVYKKDICVYTQDNSILTIWSKLVSFAYQVINLNQGNCYYDYDSQMLTAVLACDVLRRGINKMCDILQPYVSPIKFATDSSVTYCHKRERRKKPQTQNKRLKSFQCKINYKPKLKNKFARKFRSENWHYCAKYPIEKNKTKCRSSEPWRRDQQLLYSFGNTSTLSSNSIWPEFSNDSDSKDLCSCGCGSKILTPRLKLSQYIDSILNDMEET